MPSEPAQIRVEDLRLAYGDFLVQRDLSFSVRRGEVFVIMGGSGCGKSTVMRSLIGLKAPDAGRIYHGGLSFWEAAEAEREKLMRGFGVMYQGGALWSSMTLAQNIGLALEQYTDLRPAEIREVASLKLAFVGLRGFEDFYPAEISGGMRKRAAVARALAMDPEVLFFDEPSAGLDPLSSRNLDDLILELRDVLGSTIVVVTHELASIFRIAGNSAFLDGESKTLLAVGPPLELRDHSPDPRVRRFLSRGEE